MGKPKTKEIVAAEDLIVSPRSWLPPVTVEAQQVLTLKTFKGDKRSNSAFFGGTVRRNRLRAADRDLLTKFFADRFMRIQDDGCRRVVLGPVFSDRPDPLLTTALDPLGRGAIAAACSAEELLSYIEAPDARREWVGSGEVRRRKVELLAACMDWRPFAAVTLAEFSAGVERYFESEQEVLIGRPMLGGATSAIMTGQTLCRLTPLLLLANQKRREVEAWRNERRAEARAKEADIAQVDAEIAAEGKIIDELVISPKAWTRAGQGEISRMRARLEQRAARRVELAVEVEGARREAEMDVRGVLEGMWRSATAEQRQEYEEEFEILSRKYMEPMAGQRVRLSALWLHQLRNRRNGGALDVSLAPGACDCMGSSSKSSRWFGNVTFADKGDGAAGETGDGRFLGNFPDVPAGALAKEGGIGTIKLVHRDGDRVLVAWDRTGKQEWYNSGAGGRFTLALCDPDEGVGTTGCPDGLSSMRLLTNRFDMPHSEAATRTNMRKMRSLGRMDVPPPPTDLEGGKHVGRNYDRLSGTGYL